jgi:signal transduction histidine kinase/CheY-like chemotaxis protein
LTRQSRRLAVIAAALSASLALLALLGWLTAAKVLAGFHPRFIPMAPSTAIAFLLLGGAVLAFAAAPERARLRHGVVGAGVIVLLVASVELVQWLGGWRPTIDAWLVPHPALLGSVPVGRMSPLTAASFAVASASLLTLVAIPGRSRLGDLGGLLACVLVVVSAVLLLGYVYGTPLLYGGTVVPVALPTALAFVALSTSLLALAGPGRLPLRPLSGDSSRARLLRAFLPVAPAAVVADGILFRLLPTPNPALHAAFLSLLLALVVTMGVARSAHVVGRALDRLEEERRGRDRAERELREHARVLIESQRVARIGSYRADLLAGTWTGSATLDEIFGIDDANFARTVPGWLSIVHPDEREQMAVYFAEEVIGRRKSFDREYRIRRLSDGEERWVRGLGELLEDGEGRPVEMIGTIQDITQSKAAETLLRQSQKLEGIGRLAGGVAHDFNNLLGVIMGYTELASRQLAAGHPARARLDRVLSAAERAANLARQLLAFSRKQVMRLQVLDVNAALGELSRMLERVVGEDVEIELRQSPELGAVRADPTQIDQVVMNLVLNARDAMPNGGRLTIETANVVLDEAYTASHPPAQAGRYVMIAVSDTGTGMDAETQKHVFEPFFTTKPAGEGTGLGLATAYGIVKQSGGYIWVYSEAGRGTTFKIYLPRVDEAPHASARAPVAGAPAGRHETVLVVEDSRELCEMIRETLEGLGYSVLTAADGEAAVAVAAAHPGPIHLVLTDVVMPKLGGPELGRILAGVRPGIRLLYMSGYADGAISREGVLHPGVSLLEKPFTAETLARTVREALDRPDSGRP